MIQTSKDQIIHVKVPVRMDLAGGTLDIWPIYHALENPCTVNIGMELWAEVWLKPTESKDFCLVSKDQGIKTDFSPTQDPLESKLSLLALALKKGLSADLFASGGLELTTRALSPAGAGLGGSSALLAAVLSGLEFYQEGVFGRASPEIDATFKNKIAAKARDIESILIHTPTGIQDYLGALYGGLNVIDFEPGGWRVHNFKGESWLKELEENSVVYFSGQSRASAINNWEMFKAFYNKDPETLNAFVELAAVSRQVALDCDGGSYLDILRSSQQEWQKRLEIWPAIHSKTTKKLADLAENSGALLTRVFGAGGGGVMASFCQSAADAQALKEGLKPALQACGGRILETSLNLGSGSGIQVAIEEDPG